MGSISAILTAAGESTRMGRFKPLLPWHNVSLVEYQIASLVSAGVDEVVVVLGHQHEIVAPHVKGQGVRWVLNPDYRLGKSTSIKAGLRSAAPGAVGILLLAVDQPRPAHIISAVMEAHLVSNSPITSPRHGGRGGHPLIFASLLRRELETISEERQGIREVFRAHRGEVNEIAVDDPIVLLDLNSLEAYQEAKEQYGARWEP